MRARLERLWENVNEMPGPVWVFGAWVVCRLATWLLEGTSHIMLTNGARLADAAFWLSLLGPAAALLNQFLPLMVLWMLLYKKPYCVSLASLYIGMKGASMFLAIIATTTHAFNSPFPDMDFGWVAQLGPQFVCWFFVCAAFLVYLERSEVVARVFPGEQNRRLPWWTYVIALIFLVGGAI